MTIQDVVDSCESLDVPWHFRACGDDRRDFGPQTLALREEPRLHKDAAASCVVFLEGAWSHVQQEVARLQRAGGDFTRLEMDAESEAAKRLREAYKEILHTFDEPIAFILVVDPDQDMAFTSEDKAADLPQKLATLPRPLIRTPTGHVRDSHLGVDLSSNWIEVDDVLKVFGKSASQTLSLIHI